MRVTLLAVGRLRPCYREAADEYLRRLRRFWPTEEREVRAAGTGSGDPGRRQEEARRLLAAAPAQSELVALSRTGAGWSSAELARRLDRWRETSRHPVFVLGGATGLADEVLAAAAVRWSLGPLTLPHELARVIVLEQLYRAATLLHGHPYHKARE